MKKSIRFMVGALAALVACGAHATPVLKWQVESVTTFELDTVLPISGVNKIDDENLTWGDPATGAGATGPSGLTITNLPGPTEIYTNGAAVLNLELTHNNQPIFGTTLDKVSIRSTVTLRPFDPSNPAVLLPSPPAGPFLPVGPATITYQVDFQETPNAANPCADGAANNVAGTVNENGCADIFVINQAVQNLAFAYPDPDNPTFLRKYLASFFETTNGLTPLSSDACGAAGARFPCIGFETKEAFPTTIKFAARITTVPEPTTVLLMGLGLAGLGFARRRRLNG